MSSFKVQVKKVTKGTNNTWCVMINDIEYVDCQVKSVADATAATVRRDYNRHGAAAFDNKFAAA